jgi:hypothetical protein
VVVEVTVTLVTDVMGVVVVTPTVDVTVLVMAEVAVALSVWVEAGMNCEQKLDSFKTERISTTGFWLHVGPPAGTAMTGELETAAKRRGK